MSDVRIDSLYQQLILRHYRSPRHRGELPDATVEAIARNPSCGDEIRLQLRMEGDAVAGIAFQGEGCSISQAAASMMSSLLMGRSREEALQVADRFTEMMRGDEEAAQDPSLQDLRALAGVARFPVRVKCALLGFEALRRAVGRGRADSPPSRGAGEP